MFGMCGIQENNKQNSHNCVIIHNTKQYNRTNNVIWLKNSFPYNCHSNTCHIINHIYQWTDTKPLWLSSHGRFAATHICFVHLQKMQAVNPVCCQRCSESWCRSDYQCALSALKNTTYAHCNSSEGSTKAQRLEWPRSASAASHWLAELSRLLLLAQTNMWHWALNPSKGFMDLAALII